MTPGATIPWTLAAFTLSSLLACGDGTTPRQMVMNADPTTEVPATAPSMTDEPPATSQVPVALDCTDGPPLVALDAQQLFDIGHVPTFDFYMPDEQWAALLENARDEEYVEARACFDGQLLGDVGLRFKGSYGSLYGCFDENDEMICPRLSMKVKFDKYVEGQRFFGLKRLNFNAYRHDDSRMRERLSYDLFRSMGIVAPRAAWAVLRVNGESQGLYGMVEQVDGRFTDDRWPDAPDGNLYKEVWPTETSEASLRQALSTNEELADVEHFLAFAQTFTAASDADALATLGDYMDPTYLARYMAVDDAVTNYDGVTYFWTDGITHANHNFYIYERAPRSFVLIPWDVEASFWINPEHAAPHWTELPEDCSQTYPYWEGLARAPGCDLVFRALGTDLEAWRAAAREFLDGPFALDTMLANVARHEALIVEHAHADPTPPMYVTFDAAVDEIRRTIPELRARLLALIEE